MAGGDQAGVTRSAATAGNAPSAALFMSARNAPTVGRFLGGGAARSTFVPLAGHKPECGQERTQGTLSTTTGLCRDASSSDNTDSRHRAGSVSRERGLA